MSALVGLLAACAGEATPAAPPASSPTAVTFVPSAEPVASDPPVGLETPATSSGPLSRADFPRPAELGPGWEWSVDPGDVEEGYLGNGTPVLERAPAEVAALAVPFGCPRPRELPVPEHALEADYSADGVKVVAVRSELADRTTAARFFADRVAMLESCLGTVVSSGEGPLVTRVRRLGPHVILSDRTPGSDPWSELALLDGDQVVLVAARARPGSDPMTSAGVRTLATAFRR